MIKKALLAAGPLLLAAPLAQAVELSVTPTVVSDYDFRGITQTAGDPAFQLGATVSGDTGLYGFAWASNIDGDDSYPDADVEVDLGFGFAGGDSEASVGYDVGLTWYTYPGNSDFNYFEVSAALTKNWFQAKLWYSPEFGGVDASAYYLETNGSFPLPQDFGLVAHLGYSGGDFWDDADSEYFDFAIGVTKSFSNFDLALKYIDGSDLEALDGTPGDVLTTESKFVFSVSTTLPWGE